MMTRQFSCCLLAIFLLIGTGCRRESESVVSEAPANEEVVQQAPPNETPAVPKTLAKDDPAVQFATIRDAIVQGKGDEVISALPSAWLEEMASRMEGWRAIDPKVRGTFLVSIARAARAVDTKAGFIAASEMVVFDGPWAGLLNENLAGLARAAVVIAEWPGWLATGEFDAEGMIHMVVVAIAGEPDLAAALDRVEFKTVSVSDGSGVARYRAGGEGDWREFPVTRRDGVWLPARLVNEWDRASQSESATEDPTQRLQQLAGRLDDLGKTLEEVSTQAEFDAVAENAAKSLLASQPNTNAAPRAVAEEEFVTVIVSGELSDDELDQLLWNVASRTDSPASAVADLRQSDDGASVRIHVGPVADLEAFAGRLTGLAIENLDEKRRTITARVERDRSP